MSYENLDPAAARQRLEAGEGWIYLDVRTPEEFAAGHRTGAYNVPFAFRGAMGMEPNSAFAAVVERNFEKDTAFVVGCASGVRSVYACELLAGAGFGKLANMDGGYSGKPGLAGWQGMSFPIARVAEAGRDYAALGEPER
jgi:rhodanese-related sulfurtransferase